jgi:hypothetical protein
LGRAPHSCGSNTVLLIDHVPVENYILKCFPRVAPCLLSDAQHLPVKSLIPHRVLPHAGGPEWVNRVDIAMSVLSAKKRQVLACPVLDRSGAPRVERHPQSVGPRPDQASHRRLPMLAVPCAADTRTRRPLAAPSALGYMSLVRSRPYGRSGFERAGGVVNIAFACGGPPARKLCCGTRQSIVPNAWSAPAAPYPSLPAAEERRVGGRAGGYVGPPATSV